ncbi:MAG: hypothetical protein JKY65_17210 [Planctomycetes bacterium]|nr:hypothetical protein [Planctomycetota bacterium]
MSKIWTTASSEPAHADSEIQRDVNAIESSGLANAAREYQASFTDLNGRLPEGSRLERRSITLEELEAPLRDGNRLAIELGDRQRERLSGLETTLKDAHRDLKRRASAKELDEALESAGDHLDEALVSAGDQFDRALKSAGRQVEGALR